MLKYFLFWFPMLVMAVANGAARDLGYKKYLGELAAHQVSTVCMLLLFAVYFAAVFHKFPPASSRQAFYIGLLWMGCTLVFEFGFGLARGHSLTHLLQDYNLMEGRIWALVPLWLLTGPYIIFLIWFSKPVRE